jgi:type IV secretory pathway TraG/TraD family ATPase VirD4
MNQLTEIYSGEIAKSISNNCKTKIYMNIEGKEAARWCSEALGEGEIEEWHEGLSYGAHEMRDGIQVNQNRIIRPLVLASELMMLKAGEGFIKFSGFEPIQFRFADSYLKKIAAGFIENTGLLKVFNKELACAQKRRKEIEDQVDIIETNSISEKTKNKNKSKTKAKINKNPQTSTEEGISIVEQKIEKSTLEVELV